MRYDRDKSRASIRRAVELAKGQKALASEINKHLPDDVKPISQPYISGWLLRDTSTKVPPAEYVIAMVMAVDFKITPSDFRCDLYPPLIFHDARVSA